MQRLWYALLTAATVVTGLLLVRIASGRTAPSNLDFVWNRFTYLYVFVATACVSLGVGYVMGRQVERLRHLSTTDPLTDLPNRRFLESRLEQEWHRARRYRVPLSLLLIDIDGLKRVNDEGGHAAGDRLIRAVADGIKAGLRTVDVGARWGGDEFAVLAPNTPIDAARGLAERLLARMPPEAGIDTRAPASVGVATFDAADDSSDTPEALLHRADVALYTAKAKGRHQVGVA